MGGCRDGRDGGGLMRVLLTSFGIVTNNKSVGNLACFHLSSRTNTVTKTPTPSPSATNPSPNSNRCTTASNL